MCPSPSSSPCLICNQRIPRKQHFFQCSICSGKVHRKNCLQPISMTEFVLLKLNWTCDGCLNRHPPSDWLNNLLPFHDISHLDSVLISPAEFEVLSKEQSNPVSLNQKRRRRNSKFLFAMSNAKP